MFKNEKAVKESVEKFVKIVSDENLTLDLMLLFSQKISARELAVNIPEADVENFCENLYGLFESKEKEIESAREYICCKEWDKVYNGLLNFPQNEKGKLCPIS